MADVLETLQWQVIRDDKSVKAWLRLAQHLRWTASAPADDPEDEAAKMNEVNMVYERALRAIPYSYKLWMEYLTTRKSQLHLLGIVSGYRMMSKIYERALENLPMMPLLWCSYLEFLMEETPLAKITVTRHVIINALTSLPPTQHHRIWRLAMKWMRQAEYLPRETVMELWRLLLSFDGSEEMWMRYLTLLRERTWTVEFIRGCAAAMNSEATVALQDQQAFWDLVQTGLEGPLGEDDVVDDKVREALLESVKSICDLGVTRSMFPEQLQQNCVMFMLRCGNMAGARAMLQELMSTSTSPEWVVQALVIAIGMEEQIIDSLALDTNLHTLSPTQVVDVVKASVGDDAIDDPLIHLRMLSDSVSLLFNGAQLKESPRSVPLWLKRAELLQERAQYSPEEHGPALVTDVVAMFEQAIAQCTQCTAATGGYVDDDTVTQLFESLGLFLCAHGKWKDALHVLHRGAWNTPFRRPECNIALLGSWVEVSLAYEPGQVSARGLSHQLRTAAALAGSTLDAATARRVQPLGSHLVTKLPASAHAWSLAADLALHFEPKDELVTVLAGMREAGAYSAETASYAAARLHYSGNSPAAFRVFEEALANFQHNPPAVLYLTEQYASCLCCAGSSGAPINRIRELVAAAAVCAERVTPSLPQRVATLMVAVAVLEYRCGLYGHAVHILERSTHLACLAEDPRVRDALSCGLLSVLARQAMALQGREALRYTCGRLLKMKLPPSFVRAVALHWAALERQQGNFKQCHEIMALACPTQDPTTPLAEEFWRIWETYCTDPVDFADIARRKQQAKVKYASQEVIFSA